MMKQQTRARASAVTVAFGLFGLSIPSHALSTAFNANDPASTGYRLTFADEFDSLATIDTEGTGKPGCKWYTGQFFGGKPSPASCVAVSNGVLTVDGPGGYNGTIETAMPGPGPDGYIGTVFGGGAYFEAKIAFDPKLVDKKNGWPSFWSLAVEHMADKGAAQWPGQETGFERFIEVDFFEADTFDHFGNDTYSGAIHDTFGKWADGKGFTMVSNENYVVKVPPKVDFNEYHRYGCLVCPATAASHWQGYIQYYFDGMATSDLVAWSAAKLSVSVPPSGDQKFAVTDSQHLNVLLGSAPGSKMRVDYVHVWQPAGVSPTIK